MLVWTLSGIGAYAGALVAEAGAARASLSPASAARIGGGGLVTAGLYQLTPFKDLCLSKCRTPISFIMTSWRDGVAGTLRMGWLHGSYCLGCCWLLFVILFPLGIMNVAAMAVITLVIFAEKTSHRARPVARATAAALVAYGALCWSCRRCCRPSWKAAASLYRATHVDEHAVCAMTDSTTAAGKAAKGRGECWC